LATELGLSRQPINNFLNGKAIDRLNFIECCEKLGLDWQEIIDKPSITENDPNFVGRETAIAALDTLVAEGAKIILIYAAGGVGKTTLATKYLESKFKKILRFNLPRESRNFPSLESLLNKKLPELGIEPGANLMSSLDDLKEKLKDEKLGILIDNLHSGLDDSGKFTEQHRSYEELLIILGDSGVQSLTLITSREYLHESSIKFEQSNLLGLDSKTWQKYFDYYKIIRKIEDDCLEEIRDAFDGNAKAMEVISKAVIKDNEGNLENYWKRNKDNLLIELTLENLINEQFKRLLEIQLHDAHSLLCRLGCYRYQDIPTVPEAGLICLLWDVSKNKHKRIIQILKERGLLEFKAGEYFLHPVIREAAVNNLGNNHNLERQSNTKIANYLKGEILTNFSRRLAPYIFEAFYHYCQTEDYKNAYELIRHKVSNDSSTRYIYKHLRFWGYSSTLIECFKELKSKLDALSNAIIIGATGVCHYYLSNYQKAKDNFDEIKAIIEINSDYEYQRLYPEVLLFLGKIHHCIGQSQKAIEYCKQGLNFIEKIDTSLERQHEDAPSFYLESIESNLFQSLSYIYYELGDYDTSLENVENSLSKATISKDKTLEREAGDALAVKALSLFEKQQYNESFIFINKSIDCFKKIEDIFSEAYAHLYASRLYLKDNIVKSKEHLDKAEEIYRQGCKSPMIEAISLEMNAEYFREIDEHNQAVQYHQKAISLLKENSIKPDLAEAYFQLALTYKAMGDQSNSQTHFDEALKLWGPEQINAPKQRDRVRDARQMNP
jgi:tetratricopeptide (TPR) repeat protein